MVYNMYFALRSIKVRHYQQHFALEKSNFFNTSIKNPFNYLVYILALTNKLKQL
jgi:hypothetical protein